MAFDCSNNGYKQLFFFNSEGKNMEQSTEFSVKSPDGKALELMSLADQCEVSLSWKFSFPTSTRFFSEKLWELKVVSIFIYSYSLAYVCACSRRWALFLALCSCSPFPMAVVESYATRPWQYLSENLLKWWYLSVFVGRLFNLACTLWIWWTVYLLE